LIVKGDSIAAYALVQDNISGCFGWLAKFPAEEMVIFLSFCDPRPKPGTFPFHKKSGVTKL
jgi:hypothetical protein